ncbi:MAG TPA: hypothetical protein VE568_17890 [Rubrobacter sp.]|nr:hypothetical protein [Rubrobacter sp.]
MATKDAKPCIRTLVAQHGSERLSSGPPPATDQAAIHQKYWWIAVVRPERDRFMARGNLGPYVYVVSDKGLVIVRMSEGFGYNR